MRAEHLFSSCEYDKKRKRCFGKLLGDWGTCFRQKSMFLVIVGLSRSFKMLLEIPIENSVGLVDEPGLQSIEQMISPYLWRKGLALECSESVNRLKTVKLKCHHILLVVSQTEKCRFFNGTFRFPPWKKTQDVLITCVAFMQPSPVFIWILDLYGVFVLLIVWFLLIVGCFSLGSRPKVTLLYTVLFNLSDTAPAVEGW